MDFLGRIRFWVKKKKDITKKVMISAPYNFFFFNSNHALLSSKKTENSTKLSFKKEIGTFDAIFWQNDGRYTMVFAKKIIEI